MSSQPLYVLDANVFIQAATKYYAFDLVPKFWNHLLTHGAAGSVCTVDRTAAEVVSPNTLQAWITGPFGPHVRPSHAQNTLNHYAALMQWAQQGPFTPAARQEFATVSDAWLIAYAKGAGGIVVTHETFDANCRRRVKIPNACQFLGVHVADTFAMLRALGITL